MSLANFVLFAWLLFVLFDFLCMISLAALSTWFLAIFGLHYLLTNFGPTVRTHRGPAPDDLLLGEINGKLDAD